MGGLFIDNGSASMWVNLNTVYLAWLLILHEFPVSIQPTVQDLELLATTALYNRLSVSTRDVLRQDRKLYELENAPQLF